MVMFSVLYDPPSPHWMLYLGEEHQQPGGGGQAVELPLQGPPLFCTFLDTVSS
jgi:hypothetical protein